MRRTQLFIKTQRDAPSDEVAKNAQLLIRAGFVYKVMAGVYAYTPLGIRVVEKIKQIVREEMDAIGGNELIMTALQREDTWSVTNRWDDEMVDVWFKTKLKDETEVGLAWSHEEAIIEMMKQHIQSYKDLPAYVYQFQTKFRNELRSKSGIMRGREFVMKDMYSCCLDAEQHDKFYNDCIDAYMKVFDRLGLGEETYVTFASGGAFTKFSHEFQTICDAGEDTIYMNQDKSVVLNEEILDEATLAEVGVKRGELSSAKSAEVGNIFNFGTQKSEEMDFGLTDKEGQRQFVHLGSYGIGITRVMGVIAEKFSDNKGLVWPVNTAPYSVYLVAVGETAAEADLLYENLKDEGIEVLYDDRDERPGSKFADAELMGIPYRIVVSKRTMEEDSVEFTERKTGETTMLSQDNVIEEIREKLRK